ncbi:hypothetical protein G7Y89_g2558 [Cudoniella acicularis]|uniref:O-methyltransferase C-terminal domain-containing protein n=1 Tax=Cudoniella acicularis TaxID=354080 RepID=A0A8H4RU83_9HELO|nr:hypothetical protein G7Y89_g2558 [Cudoniella acicularis]
MATKVRTPLDRFKEGMQSVYGPFEYTQPSHIIKWTPPPRSGGHKGRYLWTDAFGVLNFLTLYHETSQEKYLAFARAFVQSVHEILGRTRDGDTRLPGASDSSPLAGGLRIGKIDATGPDGDGMYHHYLTLWMFALNRLSVAAHDPSYNEMAITLAKAIHPHFLRKSESDKAMGMVWKISCDMKRVLVPSEGHLDAATGYVVFKLLREVAAARGGEEDVLKEEIKDYEVLMEREGRLSASSDTLDLGMALWMCHFFKGEEEWADELGSKCLVNARKLLKEDGGMLDRDPRYRLAFREFGTCLGIKCFDGDEFLLMRVTDVIKFWEDYMKDVTPDDLRPISMVMYAAALIPKANTEKIDARLRADNLPQPSFDATAPLSVVPEGATDIETAKTEAVEALIELQQLLQGVDNLLTPMVNMTSLRAISHFKIAEKVPIEGEISFVDLAELCGLFEHDLRRIIRFAIAHHRVFQEPRKGIVSHSAASKRLAESDRMQHVVGMSLDEVWPANVKTVDALIEFNKSQEPNASGFALANNTKLPFYEYLEQNPKRAKRFGGAMSSAGTAGLQALADKFTWSSLPEGAMVVDLGGSQGHVSAFLAEAFPSLKFTVQDLPQVISDTKATYKLPETVTDRVKLMGHSFFDPQPLKDIDVILIRYVFHNWPDAYCVKILQNLIPGLKPGTKIVIQDHLMPEPNTLPLLKERGIRSMDLIMLTLFNARERDGDDWKDLVEQVDSRFKFESATRQAETSPSGIMVREGKRQY